VTPSLEEPCGRRVRLSGLRPDNTRREAKRLSGRQADKVACGQNLTARRDHVHDLYSPLVLVLAIRSVIVLLQTVEQLVVACLALRDTPPEHRAPILRALRGKPGDRTPNA
jgi:hypothetical protein